MTPLQLAVEEFPGVRWIAKELPEGANLSDVWDFINQSCATAILQASTGHYRQEGYLRSQGIQNRNLVMVSYAHQ